MRLLLTRPGEDGERSADLLRAHGHDVVCEPLLRIKARGGATLDLSGAQGLLATSANGVRAVAGLAMAEALALPLYAVGDATARAGREAGFAQVTSAGGDVNALAALVCERVDPAHGRLIHVAASTRAGDLKGVLTGHGYVVDIAVLYESEAVTALSRDTQAKLQAGHFDAVLLYSPRTARIYAGLVVAADIRLPGDLMHACLSPAVAEALRALDLAPRQIAVARRPTQDELIAVLSGAG